MEPRISRVVASALVGLLLCAGLAGWRAAPADSRGAKAGLGPRFFGVDFFGGPGSERDVRQMKGGGIRTAQIRIDWALTEPSRGSYEWGPVDGEIGSLAGAGIRAMPLLAGSPGWAVRHGGGPPETRRSRRAWAAFARAAVERYGPSGSFWAAHPDLPREPIRSAEIWNEPNFPVYWGGSVSARGYTKLLRVSATAIHAVSPRVQVVLAGLGPGLASRTQVPCWRFLGQLYRAGAKRYFDVAADHPYAPDVAGMADQLRRVARVMRRHNDRAPLYLTEVGWSSGHLRGSHLEVGPRGQAKRLNGAARFVAGHARRLHIKRFMWFDWRDPPRSRVANPDGALNFGLRRHNQKPKPAWRAYVKWIRR